MGRERERGPDRVRPVVVAIRGAYRLDHEGPRRMRAFRGTTISAALAPGGALSAFQAEVTPARRYAARSAADDQGHAQRSPHALAVSLTGVRRPP